MVFSLGETLDRVDMRMNRDAGGLAMSSSQTRIETMRDRYGCPGRTLDSRRDRDRSSQRYFLAWASYKQKLLRGPEEDSNHPPEVPTP